MTTGSMQKAILMSTMLVPHTIITAPDIRDNKDSGFETNSLKAICENQRERERDKQADTDIDRADLLEGFNDKGAYRNDLNTQRSTPN